MHFVLQTPSLQHIALVKIVTCLWNHRHVISEMKQIYKTEIGKKCFEIEEKVKNRVSALPLPQLCKQQLLNLNNFLLLEIIDWCEYHSIKSESLQLVYVWIPQQFFWTMHGSIDYAKTAELMVKDERLDVERRFELACLNCLEVEAGALFERMGVERRREYMNTMHRNMRRLDHLDLLTYFTCTQTGDMHRMDNHFQPRYSQGNSVLTLLFAGSHMYRDGAISKYWFEKLSQREIEQVLEEQQVQIINRYRLRASSMLYYLSLLNEKQQISVFRDCTGVILKCLLDWPMQSLFMEAVKCGWGFVNKEIYGDVLREITLQIVYAYKYFDYSQMFWEFWRLSPTEYKQHFLNSIYNLEFLFATKEEEFILLCLNQAPWYHLKEFGENRYDSISKYLMDDSVISYAALMACEETAALNCSKEPQDEEKRLRSEHVSRLIEMVMESRIKISKEK